ncbi:VirE N-terminal domain-containing protein [Rubritalea squalenifaciens DSM 18772]|uniref:VirE N-terminal domain-containing protein n=1 Tax=Rubritalea squalenifaciens DSM 18772 TaxID=1123071 RepID=A0A1M6GUE8_9BACT|nr:AAA family ATPase [Rubritalea squalenifaciens]SHJ13534.1 VirE N-terminal domain-containing protein [Rubritalea squalenifaciens DSM 18772]
MKTNNNLSEFKVTRFPSANNRTPKTYTLADSIHEIRTSEPLERKTRKVRNKSLSDDERKTLKKKAMPAITPAVHLNKKGDIVAYTGIICLDVDGKDNPDLTVEEIKAKVRSMPQCCGSFRSVGGEGVAVLFYCPEVNSDRNHRAAHGTAEALLQEVGIVTDKSCTSEPTRLRFLAHDPDAWIDQSLPALKIDPTLATEAPQQDSQPAAALLSITHPPEYPLSVGNEALQAISEATAGGTQLDYPVWLVITSGMLNSYGEQGRELLHEHLPEQSPGEYTDKARHRTEQHSFGTVLYYARTLANYTPDPSRKLKPRATLPQPVTYAEMLRSQPEHAEDVIENVAARGEKLMLSGGSKAGKTWAMLQLAIAVAEGGFWFNFRCKKGKVLIVNMEISDWRMRDRCRISKATSPNIDFLNLAGHRLNWKDLSTHIQGLGDYDLIILDPIYRMLGDVDENSNGQVADMLLNISEIARTTNALVAFAHHFSKGSKANTAQIDRASGAGAWARDPDALLTLTEHKTERHYTLESTLRHYPKPDSTVWRFDFPAFVQVDEDPSDLKGASGAPKKATTEDILRIMEEHGEMKLSDFSKELQSALGISKSTAYRAVTSATETGHIEESEDGLLKIAERLDDVPPKDNVS